MCDFLTGPQSDESDPREYDAERQYKEEQEALDFAADCDADRFNAEHSDLKTRSQEWEDFKREIREDAIREGRIDDDEYDPREDEDDGQPTHYEEMQDYMGGDDWDHGQYDDGEW